MSSKQPTKRSASCGSMSLARRCSAQHFGKAMVKRGRGGILLVCSMARSAGCYSLATYSASKGYTQLFGESLWAELQPQGVDVSVLMLARTRTPALARTEIVEGGPAADPDDMAEQALAHLADGPVRAAAFGAIVPAHECDATTRGDRSNEQRSAPTGAAIGNSRGSSCSQLRSRLCVRPGAGCIRQCERLATGVRRSRCASFRRKHRQFCRRCR